MGLSDRRAHASSVVRVFGCVVEAEWYSDLMVALGWRSKEKELKNIYNTWRRTTETERRQGG